MAKLSRKFIDNIDGQYYVDQACIDCDLCRQTAPGCFSRSFNGPATHSIVSRQPMTPDEIAKCEDARLSCPVNAIGKCEPAKDYTDSPLTLPLGSERVDLDAELV